MVIARFITSSGTITSEGIGYDWYQALDIAYEKLMKVPIECRGKLHFIFV